MANPLLYTRAFAKALVDHLRGNVPEFTEAKQGQGGCPTCGHGADWHHDLDMDKLEAEINKFADEFEARP